MKTLHKIIMLVLAVFMLVTVVSCSGKGAGGSRGQRVRIDWPGPQPKDLGGIVYKIVDFSDNRFFPSESELGTPIGNAKQTVMESIQEDFNITFEIRNIAPEEIISRFQSAVWAGDMFANLIITTQWSYGALIGAGLMGDLASIPTLDLNNGQWIQAVHRATSIRGQVLATAGIYDPWELVWGMYFQKGLWQELNLPDPYEMVRRGEWTWDKMQEYSALAQQDLTGDGVVDSPNDRWGMVSPGDDLLRAWYTSMGGLYWDFDESSGRLFTPAGTPNGIAIADWMRAFTEMPGGWYRASGQDTALRNEMFTNRRALFSATGLGVPPEFRAMNDDFGILPMPKRNAAQQTYLNNVDHNAPLIGISITNNQLEETGIIMEAMAARFEMVRELQRQELEDIMLRSDEDVEMLDYILPYTVFDMGHIMFRSGHGFNIPHDRLTQYVTYHTIGDFASAMEANREAIEISANEFFFTD